MNDWKIIWNSFCDEVATSVQKNNSEKIFEEDIARELFRALDWYRLNKGLIEQYPLSSQRLHIGPILPFLHQVRTLLKSL